jgi:hypothetical protein
MALIVQVLLGVLLLATFAFAFLGSRTWHWGHVLVVVGIFLSTLGFFFLAAETLRINAVLRSEVNRLDRDLTEVKTRNEALRRGTTDSNVINQLRNEDPPALVAEDAESMPSLAELDHEILLETRRRGPVWRNVAPAGIDAQSGAIRVNIPAPVPAGLRPETVVYVFEQPAAPAAEGQAAPPGRYLGEFRVGQATGQEAVLAPVLPQAEFERARLAASRGPWEIYERMPTDRRDVFAAMSEEELKQKLPPQSIEEYLRHGKEAAADDPAERKVGLDAEGNRLKPDQLSEAAKVVYDRRLRDYATEFDELARRRLFMLAEIEAVKKDIDRLIAAMESAKKLQAFRENDIKRLNIDLAGIKKERAAVEQHLAQVELQLKRVQELLAATLKQNRQLADELAARQLRSGRPSGGAQAPAEPAGPLALGTAN